MHQPGSLILDVFKQDDLLKMGLFNQGQAAPTLRNYSRVGVSFSEIRNLSLEVVGILNSSARDQSSRLRQLKDLQKTGRLLWDNLLSRSVKERLKNSQLSCLTLSLDEELVYIPWELLFDGGDFLCLKFSLGRLVRSTGEASCLQYRDLPESLKMLILANPNADLQSAYNEGLNIKNQFSHKVRKVQVDFKSTCIDKHYVKKNICDYDIVHFAGHSEFSRHDGKESGWVLKDGVFNTADIMKMGQSYSMPALVFSNACHSAQVPVKEEEGQLFPLDAEYQKANYGMASAFLFSGVRHYIGSIRKIEDNSSMVFARDFYGRLLAGNSVGESLRLSKLKLIQEYGINGLHWVNYLLYGDPGFVFFKLAGIKKKSQSPLNYKKTLFRAGLLLFPVLVGAFLLFWLPRVNPTGYYLLHQASAEYKKGNNQTVIGIAERIIDKQPDFLAAYPLAADAYQKLGNKQEALKLYLEYMLKSEKLSQRGSQLDAYVKLGWFYQIDGQALKAKEFYEKALSLSRKAADSRSEALALRKLAVWNIERNDYDQALDLLIKSASINLEHQGNPESLKNLACDYFDIGLVFANKNDYPAAKGFYEKSLRLFTRLKLDNELSDCYYNLGEIYFFEKQYQKALDHYFKGMQLDQKHQNKVNLASGYNMIGELYVEIDDLAKAEEYFKLSVDLSVQIKSRMDLAAASYNLGSLYKKKGRKNLARENWRRAQEIYRDVDGNKYQQIRKELVDLNEN